MLKNLKTGTAKARKRETEKTRVTTSKREKYLQLYDELRLVLAEEHDPIAAMATIACEVKQKFDFLWVGFYRLVQGELVIGPYQGTLGCLRIQLGKGVCGASAERQKILIVPDVHSYPGHIACDSRSKSEIVVPVFDSHGKLRGVFDLDHDQPAEFDEQDAAALERLVELLKYVDWPAS